ncbi:MAG: response regulator [Promethearchaeota archaeon]
MSKSEKKKVLIVDDAQFVRNRIKKVIEKMDFAEVIGEASNGKDAISLYKKLKPDLVTMDLVMPETDGIKAIEEIMKFDKKAKIVVVSAMGQELSILEATEKGAKDYIKKPFKEEQIFRTLERFLKS